MNNIPYIKNLYSDPSNNLFGDLRICSRVIDSCGIACSSGYVAVPWEVDGGGLIGVIRLENQMRNPPVIKLKGHTSAILDLQFNPCFSEILASGSEDLSIRIWEVRHNDETVKEIKDPQCILKGHKKKISIVDWNPLNYHILGSSGFDGIVNIWDIENEKRAFQINIPQKLSSLKWNLKGNLLSGTCIGKYMHIIDPRNREISSSFHTHGGGKNAKNIWIDGLGGDDNYILSTGFSKNHMREIKLWDIKNTSSALVTMSIDNASAPLIPHYDESTGLIYIIGKGDGNCRYYQHSIGSIRKVNEYKSCSPFRSFGFMPKQACDVYKCEIGRVYKNENNNSIRPISFYVPRKNRTKFQEDLYPPILMHDPYSTSKNWINGKDNEINRINIKDLTYDDLRITKKYKHINQSCDSIIIGEDYVSKRTTIIRQFTKKFTFFKKKTKNPVNISSEDSLSETIPILPKRFKEKGFLNERGGVQFSSNNYQDGEGVHAEKEIAELSEEEIAELGEEEIAELGEEEIAELGEEEIAELGEEEIAELSEEEIAELSEEEIAEWDAVKPDEFVGKSEHSENSYTRGPHISGPISRGKTSRDNKASCFDALRCINFCKKGKS
ncbi:coronin [Plasmodium gonderi]|uniref:Coronin n=1 Tax=Plasmodium gonderi TaxID=77519 RepID=A0A1Y1JMR1_PLAGO|nr:coronin [Plasmodium gonderi]GAW83876.1 coronin [Plasmodium gonderi]